MAESITVASRFGRVLAVGTEVLIAVVLVITLIDGGLADVVKVLPGLALVGTLVWLVFWLPSVTVSDGGVTIRNVFRTIELPWPSITQVDTRWALTVHTAYGKYAAWSAPAPGAKASRDAASELKAGALPESEFTGGTVRAGDHPETASGEVALLVRHRWEALRSAGHLSDPRLERDKPVVRLHWFSITLTLVLVAATLLTIAL